MNKKALVIIDIQKGFINEQTKRLPGKIRNYLKSNADSYDCLLFTQFINDPTSSFVKIMGWSGFLRATEYALVDELKDFVNAKNLFKKNTYSSFVNNKLVNFLKKNKIRQVYLAGIDTENCVLTFARDAFDRGFEVFVLKELCASHTDLNLHKAVLKIIQKNVGELV